MIVTEPGVYDGMPDEVYHRDPVPGGSLSSTGARRILPPGCPARFRHWRETGSTPKRTFDIGHAAHKLVLDAGRDLAVIDAADWRTAAARDDRDAAYTAGQVPLLVGEYQQVQAMADAVRQHPIASRLFADGQPEQSVFWRDEATGVWCRARYDWLRHPTPGRRRVIVDYKTCDSADPDSVSRSIARYGYHLQGAHYLDGARAVGIDDDPLFVLAFQETTPPHLITVVRLDPVAERIGRDQVRQAIDTYADCLRTDTWPAYPGGDDIQPIALPARVERQHTEEIW